LGVFYRILLDNGISQKVNKLLNSKLKLDLPGRCWIGRYLYGAQVVGGSNPLAPTISDFSTR
jgi:hypothetical protein